MVWKPEAEEDVEEDVEVCTEEDIDEIKTLFFDNAKSQYKRYGEFYVDEVLGYVYDELQYSPYYSILKARGRHLVRCLDQLSDEVIDEWVDEAYEEFEKEFGEIENEEYNELEEEASKEAKRTLQFLKEEALEHPEDFVHSEKLLKEIREWKWCIDSVMRFYPEDYWTLEETIERLAKELQSEEPISLQRAVREAADASEEARDLEVRIVRKRLIEALRICKEVLS